MGRQCPSSLRSGLESPKNLLSARSEAGHGRFTARSPRPVRMFAAATYILPVPGCDFTRRDFLRWSGVAAASPLFARSAILSGVGLTPAHRDDISPVNLELVTLTEDRAIITWYTGYTGTDDGLGRMKPAPAGGEVHWGTHPTRLHRVAGHRRETPYHYVELRGLEPGRTYYYQARSNGKPVPPTPFTIIAGNSVGTSDFGLTTGGPYSFTVPMPPPGRFLFSMVLCNDTHMGETKAGLVGGLPFVGIQQEPGLPPYPEVMLEALVHDASALDASFLLAAGDISAEAVPVDLSKAGELLARFGKYRRDYFVTRGNHDRAHTGDAYAACRAGQWQGNDCFHDHFFPGDQPTYFTREMHGLRVIGIDTYDKPGGGGDAGALSPDQFAWFREQLAQDRHQPTIVFGHHPLIVQNSPFPVTPSNTLDATQSATILGDVPRACPACSCTTPGTRTATNARSARSRRRCCTRRSARARNTRAGSRCCACTKAGTR